MKGIKNEQRKEKTKKVAQSVQKADENAHFCKNITKTPSIPGIFRRLIRYFWGVKGIKKKAKSLILPLFCAM